MPTPSTIPAENPKGDLKQSSRILGMMPNFTAVDPNAQLPRMTTREKFVMAMHDPPEERGLKNTDNNFATQTVITGVANVLKEFWPDIRKNVVRKK